MNLPRLQPRASRGFSLIEMLVAVGLLSILILALYAMFDQTQRALRASVGQVDVMEGTRTAVQILASDLEEFGPTRIDDGPHLVTRLAAPPTLIQGQLALFQGRQPVLQEVFGLKPVADNRWQVVGYFVGAEGDPVAPPTPPIGTLYRYEDRIPLVDRPYPGTDNQLLPYELGQSVDGLAPVLLLLRGPRPASLLVRNVIDLPYNQRPIFRGPRNVARVMDGILNFRVTPYDHEGLAFDINYPTARLPVRPPTASTLPGVTPLNPVILVPQADGTVVETTFSGVSMPSYLEVEIDALDPRRLEEYRALPPVAEIRNRFLTNNLANIQSFRQRIPIRSSLR